MQLYTFAFSTYRYYFDFPGLSLLKCHLCVDISKSVIARSETMLDALISFQGYQFMRLTIMAFRLGGDCA